jgi:hypothetical protein
MAKDVSKESDFFLVEWVYWLFDDVFGWNKYGRRVRYYYVDSGSGTDPDSDSGGDGLIYESGDNWGWSSGDGSWIYDSDDGGWGWDAGDDGWNSDDGGWGTDSGYGDWDWNSVESAAGSGTVRIPAGAIRIPARPKPFPLPAPLYSAVSVRLSSVGCADAEHCSGSTELVIPSATEESI